MRMRLVDAWDLEAKLRANAAELDTTIYTAPADQINGLYREFIHIIRKSPIIDAEPVRHGKWLYTQYDGNPKIGNYHCSLCGLISRWELTPYAYCPNCGAKMDGDDL